MLKEYIYAKILYNDNKGIVKLRNLLKITNCKGKFLKKKELKNLGLFSLNYTFIIYAKDNSINIFNILKRIELSFAYIQILGVIKNNLLVPMPIKINFNIIQFYKNLFFIKLFIIFLFNLFNFSKKKL
jgi:hypothetical protein